MTLVHPSLLKRKIIHVDMDAFYAAVECRDRPELLGRPVVIGGSPQSRAVVCTASYEARRFGIRSAMPCSKAFRLCPDAVFLPPDFEKYTAVSRQIHEIFARYTALIEPLSLDEAYLDVTASPSGLYAARIGREIQQAVAQELHLSCSVGVAPNKLVAKIASEHRKPAGLTVVTPEKVASFMKTLGLRKLFGVGPATERRLHSLGLVNCADVVGTPFDVLEGHLGSFAHWIAAAAQGIDDREVCTSRERKSFGREETFPQDILSVPLLLKELYALALKLFADLDKRGLSGKALTLKVKYGDFRQITRGLTQREVFVHADGIFDVARHLLLERTEAGQRPIRLLGLSMSQLGPTQPASAELPRASRRLTKPSPLSTFPEVPSKLRSFSSPSKIVAK